MARCGCSGACRCHLEGINAANVTGVGTADHPYVISVDQFDPEEIQLLIQEYIDAHPPPGGAILWDTDQRSTLTDAQKKVARLNADTAWFTTPEFYGAAGDNVTDDGQAFEDALATGRPVLCDPEATYYVNRELVVSSGQALVGRGGISGGATAQTLIRLGASGHIKMIGTGHGIANLRIQGNNAASHGITCGTSVSPATIAGSNCWHENVTVGGCLTDNWRVYQEQNSTWDNCMVAAASSSGSNTGLLIDYGAGGLTFNGCTFANAKGPNINIKGTTPPWVGGYPQPTHITFNSCRVEQRLSAGPQILLENDVSVVFDHCGISNVQFASSSQPLAYCTGYGRTEFRSCLWFGGATPVDTSCIKVDGSHWVTVSGTHPVALVNAFIDISGAGSRVWDIGCQLNGIDTDTGGSTVKYKTTASPASQISYIRRARTDWIMSAAADIPWSARVLGDAFARVQVEADGPIQFGSGAAPVDTGFSRSGPGAMLTAGSLEATRHLSPALTTLTPSGGVVTIDCALGDYRTVLLSSAATSLVLNNLITTQVIRVQWAQSSPASNFNLASVSGSGITGVQWADGHPPSLNTANYSMTSVFRLVGTILYEVGRSSDAPRTYDTRGWLPQHNGLICATQDPVLAAAGFQLIGGAVHLARVPWEAFKTLAKMWWVLTTVGSADVNNCAMGVYDTSGTRLAQTGDLSANWNNTGTVNAGLSANLAATISRAYAGDVLLAMVANGTTLPKFLGYLGAGVHNVGVVGAANYRSGYIAGVGATGLPATLTLSGMTTYYPFWMGAGA